MTNKQVCKRIASILSLYIDNKVSETQKKCIEEHLAECDECKKKYLYLKSLIKDLKASYKQVLELAIKKQEKKQFSIREHEKFMENLSPYVDNELDTGECFEFRKYLMKSQNAQKELKNLYFLQKVMRRSFDTAQYGLKQDISKEVINSIKEENEKWSNSKIIEIFSRPKALKIAILAGLILIGGFEFDQLYKQYDEKARISTPQNSGSYSAIYRNVLKKALNIVPNH